MSAALDGGHLAADRPYDPRTVQAVEDLVIIGMHAIVYAEDAARARGFLRDVLGLSWVDARDGWLIFAAPPSEVAVHPADTAGSGRQELYLMCDDVHATVAELTAQGVEFTSGVSDEGWGLLTSLRIPGGGELGLYQPRHPTALDLQA